MDVEDGHYLGAFSDRGEVIMMGQGDVSCVTCDSRMDTVELVATSSALDPVVHVGDTVLPLEDPGAL